MSIYWQIIGIIVAGAVAFAIAANFEALANAVGRLRLTEAFSYRSHHGRHQLRPGIR